MKWSQTFIPTLKETPSDAEYLRNYSHYEVVPDIYTNIKRNPQ